MANATADLTEGAALQQFLLLAKNAKGKAAATLIQQVLSAPNVFVFGEFLDHPNIQQLAGTEDQKSLDLLKIFAYGTYNDYKANSSQFPQLTPAQTKKLKQLTLVSLSNQSKLIPYSVLQQQLDISQIRDLEDLIIDAIYQGVIQGSLDQRKQLLEVEAAMGRDIKPESVDKMIEVLKLWSLQSETLMKNIKENVNQANFMFNQEKARKEEFEKKVENVKKNLKATLEAELMQAAEFEGGEFFDDRNRKGGRGKMKGHRDHPTAQQRRGM